MSIFTTSTRYLSVSEVKTSSTNTWLLALTDTQIQDLIVKAELEVDSYINYRFTEFATLETIEQQEIKIATLYIVENLFNLWSSIITLVTWLVSSETTWDRSWTYADNALSSKVITLSIPNAAKSLLNKYKNEFYSIAI